MSNKNIILPKSRVDNNGGVIILPIGKWQKMERKMAELKKVIGIILEGEIDLKEGRTTPFRDFIKKDFPQYAKNK